MQTQITKRYVAQSIAQRMRNAATREGYLEEQRLTKVAAVEERKRRVIEVLETVDRELSHFNSAERSEIERLIGAELGLPTFSIKEACLGALIDAGDYWLSFLRALGIP